MSIIETLQQVSQRYPNRTAISSSAGSISYQTFLRRVSGLAWQLQNHAIGPGSRVAIHLDRSIEMIVAIFGTLSSGAAYVPVDPENPAPRLEQIIQDSEPSLLLSRADGSKLAESAMISRLDPDDWQTDGPLISPQLHDGPAYIIYTSGSTGRPKGVVIEHASLENYLGWALAELPFTGGGVPLLSSISFDLSVTSYYPPLMKGEPLILLPPIEGGRALARGLLTGNRYSYVKITPSHVRLLNVDQRAELGCCTELLIFGGERLSPELVFQVRRDNPTLPVMNHYGPTEATVGCCFYRVPLKAPDSDTIAIGHPLPGVAVALKPEDGRFAEDEEVGELLVGGRALAKGYWRQPELTAAAFVELEDQSGELHRWYRTGDRVRRLVDGTLDFLGRADDQLKILGHRIELGEIEHALRSHPKVQEAAALTVQGNDAPRIIAAVTTRNGNLSEDELRGHLRSRLPAAMVPLRVAFYEAFPVTAGGKLDRSAILENIRLLDSEMPEATTEDLVAMKFREALGVTDIRICDDFFELGGDSLAAVEIITWASEHFQVPLETPALFENPTIESLSERIRDLSNTRSV